MFLDILELIFENLSGVISSLDVTLFELGGTSISFWELVIAFLVISIIFGFFLRSHAGSGLAGIGNLFSYENFQSNQQANQQAFYDRQAQRQADFNSRQSHRQAQADYRNSYEHYASQRAQREAYSKRYSDEHRRR